MGRFYYYKGQDCGYPVTVESEDEAKTFEYEEDAVIVAELINLYIRHNPILGSAEFEPYPKYGEGTNHNFCVRSKQEIDKCFSFQTHI